MRPRVVAAAEESNEAGLKTKRIAKPNLPAKTCAACGRPFAWRRKWRKDWDQVKCCSDACRRKRGPVVE